MFKNQKKILLLQKRNEKLTQELWKTLENVKSKTVISNVLSLINKIYKQIQPLELTILNSKLKWSKNDILNLLQYINEDNPKYADYLLKSIKIYLINISFENSILRKEVVNVNNR